MLHYFILEKRYFSAIIQFHWIDYLVINLIYHNGFVHAAVTSRVVLIKHQKPIFRLCCYNFPTTFLCICENKRIQRESLYIGESFFMLFCFMENFRNIKEECGYYIFSDNYFWNLQLYFKINAETLLVKSVCNLNPWFHALNHKDHKIGHMLDIYLILNVMWSIFETGFWHITTLYCLIFGLAYHGSKFRNAKFYINPHPLALAILGPLPLLTLTCNKKNST